MTIWQVLAWLGIPSLFVGALVAVIKTIFKRINGVMLGVQALLRAQMISEYNKWHDRGYAPIYARQNFENCWNQYHSLGANGVMDDIHERFFQLPTEPKISKKEEEEE